MGRAGRGHALMRITRPIIRLYLSTLLVFVANKVVVRPLVLAQDPPAVIRVVLHSLPNTCEAIIGTTNAAALLVLAQRRLRPRLDRFSEGAIIGLATVLAGLYVISQELGYHHLGGRNVVDPYDVVASVIGLVGTFVALRVWGVFEPAA